MLHMALQMQLINPHLVINNDEQHYTLPIEMDIIKCLGSKAHFSSLSGDLYPVKDSKECVLALYFMDNKDIKTHCSVFTQRKCHHNLHTPCMCRAVHFSAW